MNIFLVMLLAIPIVILTIFILRPSGWIESFNQAALSFGEQRPTTRIFYLFILIAILSYIVVIYYNLFLLLLRKISWRELNEKKIMKTPKTFEIISEAVSNFQKNISQYFVLALPAIIANLTHSAVFFNLDNEFLYYSTLILAYFLMLSQ